MKEPKYIPVWFRERIDEMVYQNAFGYAGAIATSRNAFHRLCWRVYWQGWNGHIQHVENICNVRANTGT